ncbi:MAG: M1 family metallopeptidase [Chloroflexota bacterium]|nr:M1 family metallopeptidase [Chloroflexota bacterium]
MLSKNTRVWVSALLLATACNTIAPPITPPPVPTVVKDDLAIYQADLISGSQGDIAQLDRPTRYNLTLRYDPAVPALVGSEDVRYFNRQAAPLNEIYFRLFANYPGSGGKIAVNNLSVDGMPAAFALDAQDTALRVALPKPLAPNAAANLHLDFSVSIQRNSKGHYADFTANDTITTMPSVYPLIPAYDSKGWHIEVPPPYGDLVYADISLYNVTMTVPTTMTVIASGSTIAAIDQRDGTATWRVIGAPMRDFDLNVTAQLQHVSANVGETTVNAWYAPADLDAGKRALKFATDALRIFESRFGTYPYLELDVVETPTTAGGIEYPGVIVLNRDFYQTRREPAVFEFDTVHEVSHQWWYGMVGDDQVNQPWVDESLAQYSTLIYYEDLRGVGARQSILRDVFEGPYNRAKSAGRDMPVNLPVAKYDESNYSAIVYDKGPLFYNAIRSKMGDPLFFQFLRTLFERYRYKIATGDDILKTAEDTCGCSLQSEYKDWILSPAK